MLISDNAGGLWMIIHSYKLIINFMLQIYGIYKSSARIMTNIVKWLIVNHFIIIRLQR